MQYRKEPILFVLALAFGAWVMFGSEATVPSATVRPSSKDVEPTTAVETMLASPRSLVAVAPRNVFVEPSEAVPLPPRTLVLPKLGPIPFVRPPAIPGQHVASWYQLRVPAPDVPETPFNFAQASIDGLSGAGTSAADGSAIDGMSPDGRDPVLVSQFDWVRTNSGTFWGQIVEPKGETLYEMVANRRLNQRIDFVWLNADKDSSRFGKPVRREPMVFDPNDAKSDQVLDVKIAATLTNEIGLRRVQIPDGMDTIPQREAFLTWLLEAARTDTSAYAEAEKQASKIVEYTKQGEDGYVWLVRVYRAQGQLEREWKLYAEIGNGSTPAWVYRGRGEIQAKLTLWEDAEDNLRKAVELDPRNPRSQASLAQFLRERGRIDEALQHSAECYRLRALKPDLAQDLVRMHIETLIAAGRLRDAEDALQTLTTLSSGGAASAALLRGAIAHARGDAGQAQSAFADARGTQPAAGLGLALCQLPGSASSWQQIHDELARVRQLVPIHRGDALAGLSTLQAVSGNFDDAVATADAARLVDPTDAYAMYATARARRLAGDLDGAVEMAEDALRQFSESADLVAELTMALFRIYERDRDPEALQRAARYSERLCALDRDDEGVLRTVRFAELRGLLTYTLEDLSTARATFDEIKDRSYFARLGLAVIAYRQRRVDDSRRELLTIVNDIAATGQKDEAKRLLDDIDDHAQKEIVRDDFERSELGSRWEDVTKGRISASLVDERLVIKGNLGQDKASVTRTTPTAGKFVSATVLMRIDGRQADQSDAAGLRLMQTGSRSKEDAAIWVGILRSSKLGLRACLVVPNDDRADGASANKVYDLTDRIPGFDPYEEHRLGLEVIEPDNKRGAFGIRAIWNDITFDLPDEEIGRGGLSSSSRGPLGITLWVEGREGAAVHLSFDDFRLVRRREN